MAHSLGFALLSIFGQSFHISGWSGLRRTIVGRVVAGQCFSSWSQHFEIKGTESYTVPRRQMSQLRSCGIARWGSKNVAQSRESMKVVSAKYSFESRCNIVDPRRPNVAAVKPRAT